MAAYIRDESFGVIPVVLDNGVWYVFLIQHQKGRHWGLPKGHPETGEDAIAAAVRELREETGLGVKRFIHKEPFVEEYQFRKEGKIVKKKVSYFLIETLGVYQLDPAEILDGKWFTFQEADLKVTFPETKSILSSSEKILKAL
jgi:bis(5'-nucleosidyl)-tetraphosphatase